MAFAAAGLNTYIWNNNLRSIALLLVYPLVILLIVWACAAAFNASFLRQGANNVYQAYTTPYGETIEASGPMRPVEFANAFLFEWWPLILTVIVIWFVISYLFHTRMIRALSHAHPVTRKEEPELYNLLENLCIARGITMPRLEIIETHARNAFASGVNEKSYAITVTRGLMNSLTRDELEAVLAHELTHIMNRDVRLMMVCIIFTGMIGFFAQLLWANIRYNLIFAGGRRRSDGRVVLMMFIIAMILWIGYLATLFTRFALSRRREYMADAGAVELTKKPEAMMSALMRIAGRARIPETTDDIAMMCIENARPFMGLFATHPPIEARIQAISEITNTPVPVLKHAGPADANERFGSGRHNPWLTSQRGARRKRA